MQFQTNFSHCVLLRNRRKTYVVDQKSVSFCSSGSADVHFDEKMKCITVAGSADSVEVATKFVKTNYVDVICRHSLKIALPGDLFIVFLRC